MTAEDKSKDKAAWLAMPSGSADGVNMCLRLLKALDSGREGQQARAELRGLIVFLTTVVFICWLVQAVGGTK